MRRFLMVLILMVLIPYVTTLAWTGRLETAEGAGSGKTENVERAGSLNRAGDLIGDIFGNGTEAVSEYKRTVIVTRNDREAEISVEEFLPYVLAAQIPADFGPETLKVQAVLARTYIYGVMDGKSRVYEEELDMDALSMEQMKNLWGENGFAKMYAKLQTAVKETDGIYLLYEGKLIEPLYCYASAGKTRSRGDEYPYLKQAESQGDLLAEGYRSLPVFTRKNFVNRINSIPGAVMISEEQVPEEIQIVERDGAGYVKQVQIGQKTYTGEEVQCALGLASPCYSFESLDGEIRVICKGIGHGYGFAQFGANEMEKEGKTYKELITHYFQNVEIISAEG